MKKLLGILGLGALSAALLFGAIQFVRADDSAPADNDSSAKMDKGHGWDKGDHVGMWKEKLGLSDSQADKLKDLFNKQREETKILSDQMKVNMDTLKLKVDSKASDGEIKALLDSLSAGKKKLQAKRDGFIDQVKTILTPTQQAKLLLEMKEHGMWGDKGMREGHDGEMGKECPAKEKDGECKHKGHSEKAGDTPKDASNAE